MAMECNAIRLCHFFHKVCLVWSNLCSFVCTIAHWLDFTFGTRASVKRAVGLVTSGLIFEELCYGRRVIPAVLVFK